MPMSSKCRNRAEQSSIRILECDNALDRLNEARFKQHYDKLFSNCHWSTPFQSWAFLTTWYKYYCILYDPVIILDVDPDNKLTAFLALARDKQTSRLFVAGTHQAEYQAWLSSADSYGPFLSNAFNALQQKYDTRSLTFKYLPERAPTDWMTNRQGKNWSVQIRRHKRPLVDLSKAEQMAKSLNKKSNKSRIRRLNRQGPLEFFQKMDPDECEHRIDEIAAHYDLRQGAINGSRPFIDDPNKRGFHVELMRQQNLFHGSMLTVGDKLAAAHIGAGDESTMSIGVFSYSPFFARQSPGKILILMMCIDLAKRGYQYLDLTPGGDWKDRFATDFGQVIEAKVIFDQRMAFREKITGVFATVAKSTAKLLGVRPAAVKNLAQTLRHRRLSSVFRFLGEHIWSDREFRIYFLDAAIGRQTHFDKVLQRDSIQDLLAFRPTERWQTRQKFLGTALQRLAQGMHVYTYVENGILIHSGWQIERQERARFSEVEQDYTFPSGTAVLFDSYTHPAARRRGIQQKSLRQRLRDAAEIEGVERIFTAALADNTPSIRSIEKVGFSYKLSLFRSRRFGNTRRSRSDFSDT